MPKPFEFIDLHPEITDIRAEIIEGLSASPKIISPKYFYDSQGSLLFDQICELPEYYPTRTEIGIIESHGKEMAEYIGPHSALYELGSGSSQKIRLLLDFLHPSIYIPLDISKDHLLASSQALMRDFPWLKVLATCVDYSQPCELPPISDDFRKVAFFPGSSIGNFSPDEAVALLHRVANIVGTNGGLLIGVDLVKDVALLENAYNDASGITAQFNKNLLTRINRELNADFDINQFAHRAFFNQEASRIEMHLESLSKQQVVVSNKVIRFDVQERLHTENSHKFTVSSFQDLAKKGGFSAIAHWTDPDQLFSIHYLVATSPRH